MRDAYYGLVMAGSLAAVWYSGAGGGRVVALAALIALTGWYCLVGRRAVRMRPMSARTAGYQLGALALLVTAQAATLSSSCLLFAAIPQAFLLLPLRWAVLATLVGNVVPVTALAGEATYPSLVGTGAALVVVACAAYFGWWIQRIIQQSRERADLIAQLADARADLAAAERAAGALAERQRLSTEIHDTLAQGFTSILMLLQAAEAAPPEQAKVHLERAARAARENLAEARALVGAQPPTNLTGSSLPDALRRLAGRLGEETGIDAGWELTGEPRPLPAGTEVVVLRCAQESLTNVRRHARAATARLRLRYLADAVRLTVADDGVGFDPAAAAGFGLHGMRERVAQVGGRLEIASTPGRGTTLTVDVPA
ncbi:two-component sensor histidine kinase [Actinocatenispora thailandica]|uniref:Oxygen sensor histidine kinase NreB n=1 Tax=Actinocatenispora thailandica TaxID=227318 RepID=A0A7R7DWJ2_9ACTN|nr:sensor histidine kinase [Actinocatenispora thailandica]BCJ39180.1 two-component sensor histidine kinase [Actinocatenispora thailandica]